MTHVIGTLKQWRALFRYAHQLLPVPLPSWFSLALLANNFHKSKQLVKVKAITQTIHINIIFSWPRIQRHCKNNSGFSQSSESNTWDGTEPMLETSSYYEATVFAVVPQHVPSLLPQTLPKKVLRISASVATAPDGPSSSCALTSLSIRTNNYYRMWYGTIQSPGASWKYALACGHVPPFASRHHQQMLATRRSFFVISRGNFCYSSKKLPRLGTREVMSEAAKKREFLGVTGNLSNKSSELER